MDHHADAAAAVLPDDVLADVLRRLAPQYLAASRCVCKAWRDLVDAHRLLRAELLPLSPGGIFFNFNNYYISEFLARPSTASARPSISGKHDYLPDPGIQSWSEVRDHCNGLLLVRGFDVDDNCLEYVLNPAMRWWAPLPPCPPPRVEMNTMHDKYYLAYDPTISSHYEVFSISRFGYYRSYTPELDPDPAIEQSEWPPSFYFIHVYSSRTGCWEERSYVREGEAAGTIADMRHSPGDQRNAIYWQGALYVHCQSDFVMRISLLNNKYEVIKPPRGIEVDHFPQFHLGKSEKGIYCASTANRRCRIRVWILNRSPCNKMEWVLMHNSTIIEWLFNNELDVSRPRQGKVTGPWILDDVNYYYEKPKLLDDDTEAIIEESSEWIHEASGDGKFSHNSNNGDKMYDPDDNIAGEETGCISLPLVDEKIAWSFHSEEDTINGKSYSGYLDILGFHPYKEILFLGESITRGLAYHFNSSKVRILGNIYPARYERELGNEQLIRSSFVYTPCWLSDIDLRQ